MQESRCQFQQAFPLSANQMAKSAQNRCLAKAIAPKMTGQAQLSHDSDVTV